MKWLLLVLSSVLVAFANAEESCYRDAAINGACNTNSKDKLEDQLLSCNSKFSGFPHHVAELQGYANHQIEKSFEYLLLATNFGTYNKNRPGFAKQFHTLSDRAWNNAIELIKHITKRGGSHDFRTATNTVLIRQNETNNRNEVNKQNPRLYSPVATTQSKQVLDLNEIQALALTLDYEKTLAKDAHILHHRYTHGNHDPEVAHFIEEKFLTVQANTIRKLSGYTNDLKNLLSPNFQNNGDVSFAYYFFDEYLAKQE